MSQNQAGASHADQFDALPGPDWVRLRPARRLAVLCAVVSVSMAAVTGAVFSGWSAAGSVATVLVLGLWEWRRAMRLGRQAVIALRLTPLGKDSGRNPVSSSDDAAPATPATGPTLSIGVRLAGDAGDAVGRTGIVMAGAFVTPWLTTVPYVLEGDPAWRRVLPHIISITPDAIDPEAFRRLRVELRWR